MGQDLTHSRFSRILVLSSAGKNKHSHPIWNCLCDCGATKVIAGSSLISGRTTSCGCRSREVCKRRNTTHGRSATTDYGLWKAMVQRCHDPNHVTYKYYGARGTQVCDRWRQFENFAEDMLPRPFPRASIDRIKNEEGYYKENCRWVLKQMQSRNTTVNVMIEIDGVIKPLVTWCEELNLPYSRVQSRIKTLGWSPIDALIKPFMGDYHGQAVKGSKLSAEQVLEIRATYALGGISHKKLGALYGVSDTTVRHIVSRKKWSRVA